MSRATNRHRGEELQGGSTTRRRSSSSSRRNDEYVSNNRRKRAQSSHSMEVDDEPNTNNNRNAEYDDDSAMIVYKGDDDDDGMYQKETTSPQSPIVASPSPQRGAAPEVQCMPRGERRKRRFQWRELANHRNETPDSPEEEEAPLENAFASLQQLLATQQQQQQQSSQATAATRRTNVGGKENAKENAMECDLPSDDSSGGSSAPEEPTLPQKSRTRPFSPPDFEMYDDDDDDGQQKEDDDDNDNDNDGRGRLTSRQTAPMQQQQQHLADNKDHYHEQNQKQPQRAKSRRPSSPSRRVEKRRLEKPTYTYSSSQSTPSQRQALSVALAPSIVGSRPKAWNRPAGGLARRFPSSSSSSLHHSQRNNNRLSKAGALAAATRAPSLRLGTSTKVLVNKKANTNNNNNDTSVTPLGRESTARASSSLEPLNKSSRQVPTVPITFTPSFLPSMPLSKGDDTTNDNNIEDDGVAEILDSALESNEPSSPGGGGSFISPLASTMKPKQKRSRNNHNNVGPLSQRLATLLKVRSTDTVRLQNPAFSRHRALDLNDPRKKARSYTDIAILGSGVGPWAAKEADTKRTVLVYVHRHVLNKRNNHDDDNNKAFSSSSVEKELAWACFDHATARAIGLRGGIVLRIYNAQFIPSRHQVKVDPNFIPDIENTICRYFVVCTCLCEPYPRDQEPLPEIVVQHPASAGKATNNKD